MKSLGEYEIWFLTGSQHLYGEETLRQVADHAAQVAAGLDDAASVPVRVVFKPVVKSPEGIKAACVAASADEDCVGVIAWMHTFSPAKMWIAGSTRCSKPLLHLHTQFNRDLPWAEIDMDFMNLNQSAHGDREFGFIATRLRLAAQDRGRATGRTRRSPTRIGAWARAAAAGTTRSGARSRASATTCARSPSPRATRSRPRSASASRSTATASAISSRRSRAVADAEVDALCRRLRRRATTSRPTLRAGGDAPRGAARGRAHRGGPARLPERRRLQARSPTPSRTSTACASCPGIAVQRLMADGYGFGAEGDWKTAALVRA